MAEDLEYFQLTMGVCQGCPMPPLPFSVHFDWAVHHIHQQVESMHMLQVGSMNIAAALCADDVALLAPAPTSLLLQINSLHAFCSAEFVRISGDQR